MELAGKADAIGAQLSGNARKTSVDNMSRKVLSMMHLTDFLDSSSVVFFDLFHRVTIVYDGNTAIVLYVLILFFTSSVWIIKAAHWTAYDWIACSRMALTLISCMVASFASATFGSFIYSDLLGLKLVWYGSIQKALLIYVPHVLFGFTSMLLFLLPRKLSINRFDHMLLAKTLYCLAMATYFMRKRIMSAYLPLSMVFTINICAIQGRRVSAFLRHLQIAITIAVLTASQTKSTLAVTLPIIGFTQTEAIPHDTIAALIVAYCSSNLVVVPCLPILCEYAAALRRLVRIFLATSLFVAFSFLLMEERIPTGGFKSLTVPKKISSDKHVPYSKEAPKRLTVVHFHSPNMTPSSVLMLARHDALMANEKRILSPLFSSDQEVASLSADPKFGALEGTPMEAFYLYASRVQSKTFLRTSRAPELPMPVLQKAAEQRVNQGWNISYILKGSDSHVMSLRFAKNGSSVVKDWSFNFDVNTAPNMTWIRCDGSDSFSFWLLLEENTVEPSASPTATFVVSSARYGASRSKDDLSKLDFEFWESPSVMVSSAAEYVL